MVKVADIECLFKKYLEEGRIECADALYPCAKLGKREAAETLRSIRYKMAAPLTSALEDIKQLGIQDPGSYKPETEDTNEYAREVIIRAFERLCLDKFVEEVEKRAENLSPLAKECLYLLAGLEPETFGGHYGSFEFDIFRKIYIFLFQREIDEKTLRRAFEELTASGVLQHPNKYVVPEFFDVLMERVRRFLPRVEVKVIWPEKISRSSS